MGLVQFQGPGVHRRLNRLNSALLSYLLLSNVVLVEEGEVVRVLALLLALV